MRSSIPRIRPLERGSGSDDTWAASANARARRESMIADLMNKTVLVVHFAEEDSSRI
jgi:hypothetical protein